MVIMVFSDAKTSFVDIPPPPFILCRSIDRNCLIFIDDMTENQIKKSNKIRLVGRGVLKIKTPPMDEKGDFFLENWTIKSKKLYEFLNDNNFTCRL